MKHLATITPTAYLRLLNLGINLHDGQRKTAEQRKTIIKVAEEALAERERARAQIAEINARRAL